MKRQIQINKKEFTVYGKAPWMLVDVKATDRNPAGVMIIETQMLSFCLGSATPLRYNVLTAISDKGADIPVLFVGDKGREQAEEVVYIINRKLV